MEEAMRNILVTNPKTNRYSLHKCLNSKGISSMAYYPVSLYLQMRPLPYLSLLHPPTYGIHNLTDHEQYV